ncbi:MAG: amino acid permease [Kiritimatiellae bacterium]|nr:amino acid permease [Kiritimatiellia bacterium]
MPAPRSNRSGGYNFGTFAGVFTPSILTIIGVVMYLRFGWVLGSVGLPKTLIIVTLCSLITFFTGLSVSALATNIQMKAGGAYFMIARSFGIEIGAAIGIPLFLSQAIAVAFYTVGFTEALTMAFPFAAGWDPRIVGLSTLAILAIIATFSASLAMKTQFVVMAFIALSLVSFFLGGTPAPEAIAGFDPAGSALGDAGASLGFWTVLAIFFPAVTGILSGVGMSGDLKNPARSLPLGTIGSVLTGYAIYMAVPVALYYFVGDNRDLLLTDSLVMMKCARWGWTIIAGVWAATLSSALGSLLSAPRTLQALANDGAVPKLIGRGFGKKNDPRIATLCAILFAAVAIWLGDINAIAPVLTIFNLSAYALLNLSSMLEELMGNPSWRPSFRVSWVFSALGFFGCAGMMFMISPLATGVAAVCSVLIWYVQSRRMLVSTWGDMRTGLLMYLTHWLLGRLSAFEASAHAWRPNLLVFAGRAEKRPRLTQFINAIAGVGGFVNQGDRAQAREAIEHYGYGPLKPNTIVFGDASRQHAEAIIYALRSQRNVLVFNGETGGSLVGDGDEFYLDVWWRGMSGNGAFMLALAQLILRSPQGQHAQLRMCHILEPGEDAAQTEADMAKFLADERIPGQVVLASAKVDPLGRIAIVSGQSPIVLIGLRRPFLGETAESYGDYLDQVKRTVSLPNAIFACAAEGIIFRGMFND